jgi:ADP-ribosylglycohydrolase
MDPNRLKDRFIGAIAGFAIGDALGMPAEFLSRDQILQYYGKPISGFLRAHPGHASDFLPQGSYTDNTQTMIAVAECLIECRKMDPARHAEALLSWCLNTVPHRTPSSANLKACKHLSMGRPWNKSGVFSSDCAAAMRMVPIGLVFNRYPEKLTRAALDNCVITHNEPRARAAAVCVAYLTAWCNPTSDAGPATRCWRLPITFHTWMKTWRLCCAGRLKLRICLRTKLCLKLGPVPMPSKVCPPQSSAS